MRSASIIMFRLILLICGFSVTEIIAQENSPYSRYGLGDIHPSQHIASRAMGGLATPFVDGQAINSVNPATYGYIQYVTYDLGISVDKRVLKSASPTATYNSTNFIPSYIQLGVPINRKKKIGLALGLKPITRISYSIIESGRLPNVDSIETIYEGSGGLNQVFVGIGKKWKNLSFGLNTGYSFGRKEINTRTSLINDTVLYYRGLSGSTTSFGGMFLEGGLQYEAKLGVKENISKKSRDIYLLRLGVNGSLKQQLNASQDKNYETFIYDASGGDLKVDSVSIQKNISGKIIYPSTYSAGIMLHKAYADDRRTVDRWMLGAEFTMQNWKDEYSFYNEKDKLINSWILRAGAQITPDVANGKSYWSRVTYRAGFFTGKDYINADGNELKLLGATFGLGFPIRKWRTYDNQFSLINTAIEFGKRGSNVNNITESFFKFSVGLSLSDVWFIKRKYD